MDDFKIQIQRSLVANVIKDKCAHNKNLIFDSGNCSADRIIRFSTRFLKDLVNDYMPDNSETQLIYEAENRTSSFVINFVFVGSPRALLLKMIGNNFETETDSLNNRHVIQSWDITSDDPNMIFKAFDDFIEIELKRFEAELKNMLSNSVNFSEGESVILNSQKYERNPEARKACLEYYGTACIVCGIDFGKDYGPEFKDKIEVHHIVPISKIGKKYKVNPVKDLVPVCPNCHMAIHSKTGGIYTINEMKDFIKQKR